MNLQYEEIAISIAPSDETLIHVRDLESYDRAHASQLLGWIAARSSNPKLNDVRLGHGLDDYDLVA